MSYEELIPIYQTTDVGRAEIIKAALEEQGIHCAIENAHQAGLSGVLECRLHVLAKDEAFAREFISQHEKTA
ncbi:DUF2007 domain-containing protein [Planctomicrobium sp. SH661]|uniref:putative signal transducing protein n=1 Tax=Planctomicrobium sp. SH661 TaxID=3448124 RepID=UPI003F5CA8ED